MSLFRLLLLGASTWLLVHAGVAIGESPIERIAVGSCADQDKPQPIWDGIIASRPDLFLFLGDTVYADTFSMDTLRATYSKLGSIPGFQRARAAMPMEAVWDDHDFGENDAGASYRMRAESQQVFLDFFGEPEDTVRRETEGIYTVKEYGPPGQRVQLILLDTRYFRSPWTKSWSFGAKYRPDPDPSLTMLGEAQWDWLAAQLDRPADVRLIASGVQIINDEHGYETWGNFPHERERLFQLIAGKEVGGVILLSGDRHFAEIAVIDAVGYPLYELTASGMTHSWPDGPESPHSHRVMAYGELNFGSVSFDWSAPDPAISLNIHDVQGKRLMGVSTRLSELQPGAAEP